MGREVWKKGGDCDRPPWGSGTRGPRHAEGPAAGGERESGVRRPGVRGRHEPAGKTAGQRPVSQARKQW